MNHLVKFRLRAFELDGESCKMPATVDYNRLARKLLDAWCFRRKTRPGGQLKTLRKSYLDLLRTSSDKWCTLFHPCLCEIFFTYEEYVAYGEYFPEKQMIVES